MDIKQLITFLEVARQKSFTRTSEILYLTQPTVSNHIKSLEQELGVHLFVRSKKQITLTNAGLLFHGYAQRIIEEFNAMNTEIKRYTGTQEGHLRLFASSVPRRYIIPKLMQAFHEKFPHITFTVTGSDSRKVVDNLLMGETDFGFTGAYYPASRLNYDPIFSDHLVLVTNDPNQKPANGVSWELGELSQMKFILREEGSGTRSTLERTLKKAGLPDEFLEIMAYVEDTRSILEMVQNGLGQAIVSNLEAALGISNGWLYAWPIEILSEPRDFYFVYHTDQKNSSVNRIFFQFVKSYFSDTQRVPIPVAMD